LQQAADPGANLLALDAERRELRAGPFGGGGARSRGIELGAEPRVLFGRARLFRAGARQLLVRPRALGPRPLEKGDELLQLLFEPIDGFQVGRGGRDRCLCHSGYLTLCQVRRPGYLRTAPCAPARALTMRSMAASTSASVIVRSGERNVRRSDRLTRSSGTPLPLYRSNSIVCTSVEGAADRIVPRTAAAGKLLSTRIDRSRTIDGNRGSDSARRSSPSLPDPSASASSSNAQSGSSAGQPRASAIAGSI